jgi:hypothetical protein
MQEAIHFHGQVIREHAFYTCAETHYGQHVAENYRREQSMSLKKTSVFFLIILFLLCINIIPLHAQTDSVVTCTFTIGSDKVVINNHGEVTTKELCLPIEIESDSNRAKIDYEGFLKFIYPHIEMAYNVLKIEKSDCELYFTFYTAKTESKQLTLIYPYDKAFFSEGRNVFVDYDKLPEKDKITLPFAVYRLDTEKAHFGYTYLMPLRLLFENTGHSVDWNPDTQEITVTYKATEVEG